MSPANNYQSLWNSTHSYKKLKLAKKKKTKRKILGWRISWFNFATPSSAKDSKNFCINPIVFDIPFNLSLSYSSLSYFSTSLIEFVDIRRLEYLIILDMEYYTLIFSPHWHQLGSFRSAPSRFRFPSRFFVCCRHCANQSWLEYIIRLAHQNCCTDIVGKQKSRTRVFVFVNF